MTKYWKLLFSAVVPGMVSASDEGSVDDAFDDGEVLREGVNWIGLLEG